MQANDQVTTDAPAEVPPGWWEIPKTTVRMKIGGYVKFDLIHDFDPISSPDYFDVSTIPTDRSKGGTTRHWTLGLGVRKEICMGKDKSKPPKQTRLRLDKCSL